MKIRFRLIHRGERGSTFYCVDSETGARTSLKTKDRDTAQQIVLAKNQSLRQPSLNMQIAKAYLAGTDSGVATRTWLRRSTSAVWMLGWVPFFARASRVHMPWRLAWITAATSFFRKKTGVPVLVHLGSEALNLLKDLPSEGPLFP